MWDFSITLPLAPIGKGEARRTERGIVYTPATTRRWMDLASALMRLRATRDGVSPIAGAVELAICARFAIPKSRSRGKHALANGQPHAQKPDHDNVAKIVCDSLVRAGVLLDDRQIATSHVRKIWVDDESRVDIDLVRIGGLVKK